jgi:hypothetical protein
MGMDSTGISTDNALDRSRRWFRQEVEVIRKRERELMGYIEREVLWESGRE